MESIRWNECEYAFYSNGTGGQIINNLFIRCYVNAAIIGYQISGFKNTTWISCNNGEIDNGTYMKFIINSNEMKIIGCNFEGGELADHYGAIDVESGSSISIENCTFIGNSSQNNDVYEIYAKNQSVVNIKDCIIFPSGQNAIKTFGTSQDAKLIYQNIKGITTNYFGSTIPPLNLDNLIPSASGTATLETAENINTGLNRKAKNVVLTIQYEESLSGPIYNSKVIPVVVSRYSTGVIKIRFYDSTTGNQIFNTEFTVNWIAY